MKLTSVSKFLILIQIAFAVSALLSPSWLYSDHKLCEDMTLRNPDRQKYSVNFDNHRNLITVKGPFEIGIVAALEKEIKKYPATTGIVLDSHGGNVYQARGMAKLVVDNELDTYTFASCYSACTLVFISGKTRHLGFNGKLGFHSYQINPYVFTPQIDLEKEQQKDLEIYSEHISNTEFIEKIFAQECTGIWEPHLKELINANVVHKVIPE